MPKLGLGTNLSFINRSFNVVATSTPVPTSTLTPTPSPRPSPSVTPTPDGTPYPTPTPSPSPSPSPSPTPSPSPSPSPTPTATPPPPAANDASLEVWYDAANSANFNPTNPTNETYLNSWINSGTFVTHDANTTGNNSVKPRYRTNIQNGRPAIYFDGVNDQFTINPWNAFQSIQKYTYFAVLKTNATSTDQVVSIMKTSSAEVKGLYLANKSSTWHIGGAGGEATAPATVDTNFHIFTTYFDGTQTNANQATQNALRLNMRIDGSPQTLTFLSNPGTTTNASTTYLYLGTDTSNNNDFDGYIGEIIIYTKLLTLTEIGNIESYLKNKWGIA